MTTTSRDAEALTQSDVLDDPLARVGEIADLVSTHAGEGEALGQLATPVVDALATRRLFQLLVPSELGGYGADLTTAFDAISLVAKADGAAGWCVCIGNSANAFAAGALGEAAAREVFGGGPVVIAGALVPRGESNPVEGGYRLSGRWPWGSGSGHAQWITVSTPFRSAEGGMMLRLHVVPVTEFSFVDNWHVMGLKGTHSCDYTAQGVFVPAHRTVEYSPMTESFLISTLARGSSSSAPRQTLKISTAEQSFIGLSCLAAFALGVAERALDEFVAAAPKTRRLTADGFLADDTGIQTALAEVEGRLRVSRYAVRGLLREASEMSMKGLPLDLDRRVAFFQTALTATRAARDAVLFAYEQSGAGVVFLSHPIQRCLRDLMTGLKHAAASPQLFARVGRARLGFPNVGL